MKKIVYTKYGSPEVLELIEAEEPVPKDNEVLIKIYATTVTAVDCIFRRGDAFFARLATGVVRPKITTLGTEFAGRVESVGKNVRLFKEGDRIFGDSGTGQGTYSEYICLPEDAPLAIMPSEMNWEEAASIPYGALTALPFLRDTGNIQRGHKVIVNGAAGSVGTFAVQLAAHFGAEVTGVCRTANSELVKSLGADNVIDYTEVDFTKCGDTYDIIFDTVGKISYSRCRDSLKNNGIYLAAVLSITILMQMLWTSKMGSKKVKIAFTGLRPINEKTKDLAFVKELVKAGKIKPIIDRCYRFEQIPEAHRYVQKGHKRGSVVIAVEPEI